MVEEQRTPAVRLMRRSAKGQYNVSDIVRSRIRRTLHEIGKINVFDKFTFVEVSQEYSDRVIRSLNDIMLKGRRVKSRQHQDLDKATGFEAVLQAPCFDTIERFTDAFFDSRLWMPL
jgi:hypothetical protein